MLTVVTGNPNKAKEIGTQLGVEIAQAALDLYEIQSLDIREIIEAKAREAYAQLKTPVLVDDASVSITALGGLPGPLIKWFLHAIGNEGICRFADGAKDRSATASVALGYFDGIEFVPFIAELKGSIALYPSGTGGFGWDPIFIPEGGQMTRADLSPKEYNRASMRRIALDGLKQYLQSKEA